MENATKALLIAAAVLVAILIISLGLVVYNMASETIDSVNFSGQEITAFNDKFEQYEGSNVRGSEVNAMLKTVLSSNMQSQADGLDPNATNHPKFVEVTIEGETDTLQADETSLAGLEADTSRMYQVVCDRDADTGFINSIEVTFAP